MEKWLAQNKFLCGPDMTIADISAAHEVHQLIFIAFDLKPFPKVKAWLHTMIDESPEAMETTKMMREFAPLFMPDLPNSKL